MQTTERAERAAEDFSALANPLRVRILLALADTRRPNWDHRGMGYSDLRTAVGVEDGGRFNYHLGELRGEYVEAEDGHYWLTTTGARVVDELYAGTFGGASERREGTVDAECRRCGERLCVAVEEGVLVTECPEHGVVFDMRLSPRVAGGRSLDELLAWAVRLSYWYMESVAWDVCPHCGGSFGEATFEAGDGGQAKLEDEATEESAVLIGHTCDRCGIAFRVRPQAFAMNEPAVVAFLYEHGIDRRSRAALYPESVDDDGAERLDDTVLVWFEIDGDRIEIELDRTLDTVAVRREDATTDRDAPDRE